MKVLILGASTNPERYSNIATERLLAQNHEVIAVGNKSAEIFGITIHPSPVIVDNLHTVTMYLAPQHQKDYYAYIINLNPKRIIFNPGTENPDFQKMAKSKGIEVLEACTLVMLSIGSF